MASKNQICKAIAKKKVVSFNYGGGERFVELYRQGTNRTTDKLQVRAFQKSGFSSSGNMGWKLFNTSEIKNVKSSEENITFPRDDFNPKKQDQDIFIYCQVS